MEQPRTHGPMERSRAHGTAPRSCNGPALHPNHPVSGKTTRSLQLSWKPASPAKKSAKCIVRGNETNASFTEERLISAPMPSTTPCVKNGSPPQGPPGRPNGDPFFHVVYILTNWFVRRLAPRSLGPYHTRARQQHPRLCHHLLLKRRRSR